MPKPLADVRAEESTRSRPLDLRIMEVLERDRANAYTALELYAQVERVDAGVVALVMLAMRDTQPLEPYQVELQRLVQAGRVQRYEHVAGGPYYAAAAK